MQSVCASSLLLSRAFPASLLALTTQCAQARAPGSAYAAGRSSSLLKIKRFVDAEARMTGHTAGKGRLATVGVGALQCQLKGGITCVWRVCLAAALNNINSKLRRSFDVGSGLTDAQRRAPPPVGSIITFRYARRPSCPARAVTNHTQHHARNLTL
jgi:DNA ligase-1